MISYEITKMDPLELKELAPCSGMTITKSCEYPTLAKTGCRGFSGFDDSQ